MTKPSDLPLYLSVYKLLKYLYGLVSQFPKSHKHTLGESVLSYAWEVLDLIIEANNKENTEKHAIIKNASSSFDKLKTRLRLAHELKLISTRKYAHLIEQNEEIGRMLTGWMKWSKRA